jgi:TetR/AcrR family transcriptional regulator
MGQVRKSKPVRDAEATQQQILDAAELEFARHGLYGARLSAIAKAANVTTAMIHYYFENKEGLYKAVLQRPADELTLEMAKFNLDEIPPVEALETMIRAAIAYEVTYPHRQMLWFQEANQNRGEYFKLSQQSFADLHAYLFRILERGMASGLFRELDPKLTTLHIISVCIFYFTVHENWKHFSPERDRLSPEEVERHTQMAIEFILAGVKNNL